jgi:hypothetical protein
VAAVEAQGLSIRDLKKAKAPKGDITAAVAALLELKAKYQEVTGEPFPCPRQGSRGTAVALQLSPSDIWGLLRRDICSFKSRTSKVKTPLGTYLRAMGMRVLKGHVAAFIWPRQ